MKVSLVPPRSRRPEILDRASHRYEEIAPALRDIGRVNRWLGGSASLVRPILDLAARERLREISVLDVGTGGADVPRSLLEAARRRGLAASAVGVDLDPLVMRFAAERSCRRMNDVLSSEPNRIARPPRPPEQPDGSPDAAAAGPRAGTLAGAGEAIIGDAPPSCGRLALVQADGFTLPFPRGAFDFVSCSLFFHHFGESEASRLLSEFERVARRAVLVSDLARHLVPWAAISLLGRLFAESAMFRHDAPLSVLRGWTADELRGVAAAAGLGGRARILRFAPYRLVLVVETGGPLEMEEPPRRIASLSSSRPDVGGP